MIQKTKLTRSMAVLVLSLTAFACGDDSSNNSADRTADGRGTVCVGTGEPESGGTFRFSTGALPEAFDPVKLEPSAVSGGGLGEYFALFGALVVEDRSSENNVEMVLAESVESSDGGLTWLLSLRPDIRFTDGTPFDAEAVKFNWDRIADPANASPSFAEVEEIASYEVVDPLTLEVTLESPNAQWERVLAGGLSYIGSPTALRELGEQFATNPVGAGPFVFVSQTAGVTITFERNEDYYDAPRPYVDQLVMNAVRDEQQRFDSLRAGEADAILNIRVQDVPVATDAGLQVLTLPQVQGTGVQLNTQLAPTDDVRVRRAILLAVDLKPINDAAYGGIDPPTSLFTDPAFGDPSVRYPEPDLEAAQELIDQYVAENGEVKIDYTYAAGTGPHTIIAELIQAQVQQLDGVTINLNAMDFATYVNLRETGQLQMSPSFIPGAWPDPALWVLFHSTGRRNGSGYSNPDMDRALERARATTGTEEQVAAYADVQRILLDDVPYFPLRTGFYYLMAHSGVRDLRAFGDAGPRTDLVWFGND